MPFSQVPGATTFQGHSSAISHTVLLPNGETSDIVSVFARLGTVDGHGALGRRSFSMDALGAIAWEGGDWQNLGGDFASDPVAAPETIGTRPSTIAPHERVFLRGMDNALWIGWFGGTHWSGPDRVGGEFAGDLSVVNSPRGIHVFVKGMDDQLWAFYYSGSPAGPADMQIAPLGGRLFGNPQAVTDSRGRIHVFASGQPPTVLIHNWSDSSDGGWHGFESAGGYSFFDPTAVAVQTPGERGISSAEVYAIFQDREGISHQYCRVHENGSYSFETLPSELSDAFGRFPVGASIGGGKVDLFMQGSTGFLMHASKSSTIRLDPPFTAWRYLNELGGPFLGRPSVVAASGRLHVFVCGADHRLWHTWFDGTAWH